MAILVDLHSHTAHSHAKDSAADMAAAAFAKGLRSFGLSEHAPRPETYAYPQDYREKLRAGFPLYIEEVLAEKKKYEGKLEILLGVEVDYMPDERASMKNVLKAASFDYAIGGLHFLDRWGFDGSEADWRDLSDAACFVHFARYYDELKRMAECRLFQIAAHPDLIKLFRKNTFDAWLALPDSRERVRAALAAIKNAGMAMELSSAGLRKVCREAYPGEMLMELARDMAIPITFGSDSHMTEHVAFAFEELAAYASRFGYTQSAVFRNKTMTLQPFV